MGVGLLLVVTAGGAALSQGVALAQSPTPAPTTQPATAPNQQGGPGDMLNAFWSALAGKLGITLDDLKAKAVDARKQVIEQQVTDGKLTRAQADEMEQRLSADNALIPFGGPRGGFPGGLNGGPGGGPNGGPGGFNRPGGRFGGGFNRGPGGFFGGTDSLEAEAKALNLTPSALVAELQSGKSLADIAKAQNVDEAVVKQAIIDTVKARIAREVQDGLLTQAQADQMLSRLTADQIDLSRTGGHPGPNGQSN